jgi:hypothetical protein
VLCPRGQRPAPWRHAAWLRRAAPAPHRERRRAVPRRAPAGRRWLRGKERGRLPARSIGGWEGRDWGTGHLGGISVSYWAFATLGHRMTGLMCRMGCFSRFWFPGNRTEHESMFSIMILTYFGSILGYFSQAYTPGCHKRTFVQP